MDLDPRPIVLEGEHVRLEPLALRHAEPLHIAGKNKRIWIYLPIAQPTSLDETIEWIQLAIDRARDGLEIPFAIISIGSGAPVGSTRLLNLQPPNSAIEIGWTWIATETQRTAVNTECKWLLLSYAFATMGVGRVQLKTDGRNRAAQAAISRIGATREGTLRKERRNWDGFVRDTVYFSVIDSEWPAVEKRLRGLLRRS